MILSDVCRPERRSAMFRSSTVAGPAPSLLAGAGKRLARVTTKVRNASGTNYTRRVLSFSTRTGYDRLTD
jgi:hypothetical protein